MYRKILVALENSRADASLLPHVTELATLMRSELLLVHVADGWAARNFEKLKLTESEEIKADREYLETAATDLRAKGLTASTLLLKGNPPEEILKAVASEKCDLIAMGSHGHRLIGDLVFGSTIHEVRHKTSVPILLVKAAK